MKWSKIKKIIDSGFVGFETDIADKLAIDKQGSFVAQNEETFQDDDVTTV